MKTTNPRIKEVADCAISVTRKQKRMLQEVRVSLAYQKGRAVSFSEVLDLIMQGRA